MARPLPSLEDFPIPRDVAPGKGWSPQMLEMADHIGAYETLLVCDGLGGRDLYVPADAAKSPFLPLIGAAKAKRLSWAFRRETITISRADYALRRARRAGIIASVRSGDLTVADAARIMGVRRDYASRLVNHTDEGVGTCPAFDRRKRHDPRQLDMFEAAATG